MPRTLRARLLRLCHNPAIAGHPGQNRLYHALRRAYYWPHLAADVASTVRGCWTCAMNRVKLWKHLNRLRLFPATRRLESLAIDILGPLPKNRAGKSFLLVITDHFTKLTKVVALRTTTAYTVATTFCDAWVFKYGVPRSLLSDNGPQFNAKFFQSVCRVLGITNLYTSAYHPQTNGQVERYNRTIASMLCNYVNEHQDDWDVYLGPLTYAYKSHVHRSTRTTPFELVLSRPPPELAAPPPEFSLRRADGDAPPPIGGHSEPSYSRPSTRRFRRPTEACDVRRPVTNATSINTFEGSMRALSLETTRISTLLMGQGRGTSSRHLPLDHTAYWPTTNEQSRSTVKG